MITYLSVLPTSLSLPDVFKAASPKVVCLPSVCQAQHPPDTSCYTQQPKCPAAEGPKHSSTISTPWHLLPTLPLPLPPQLWVHSQLWSHLPSYLPTPTPPVYWGNGGASPQDDFQVSSDSFASGFSESAFLHTKGRSQIDSVPATNVLPFINVFHSKLQISDSYVLSTCDKPGSVSQRQFSFMLPDPREVVMSSPVLPIGKPRQH
jgi:hypothetical protein